MAQSELDMEAIQSRPATDEDVCERVRAKLSVVFSDLELEVKAKAGVVTLIGQIRDSAQSRAASLITHRVEGVTNVVNKLTIGRAPLALAYVRSAATPRAKAPAPRRSRRATSPPAAEAAAGA